MQDLLGGLGLGFGVALTPANLGFCFLGALVGTLVGVLPGPGPVTTIALLPLTFGMPPETALILLAGIFHGAQYGGSTTSILLNMPGEAASVVTCLDGRAMARHGRAGAALAVTAIGSFVGGTVSTAEIAVAAAPLAGVVRGFTSVAYCALMAFGLVAAIVLANGSVANAVGMIVLGLLLGLVGTDVNSGQQRFVFRVPLLADRLDFVAVITGLFGLAEVMLTMERYRNDQPAARVQRIGSPGAAAAAPFRRGRLIRRLLHRVRRGGGAGAGRCRAGRRHGRVGALPGGVVRRGGAEAHAWLAARGRGHRARAAAGPYRPAGDTRGPPGAGRRRAGRGRHLEHVPLEVTRESASPTRA
jgi:TctA family transporter